MLAISTLSAGWKAFFFALSLVLFLVGTFRFEHAARVRFECLGLAFFVFPFFWDNLAAS